MTSKESAPRITVQVSNPVSAFSLDNPTFRVMINQMDEKPRHIWSPLHIKLMLHYYSLNESVDHSDAPAVIGYTKELLELDLIVKSRKSNSGYEATERGCRFIKKICATSLPEMELG